MGRRAISGGSLSERIREKIIESERINIALAERSRAQHFIRRYALEFDCLNEDERKHLSGVMWQAWLWAHPELDDKSLIGKTKDV